MDIVLIQTGADEAWGTEQYLVKGAGMDRESTLFLTEKGVKAEIEGSRANQVLEGYGLRVWCYELKLADVL